MTKFLRLLLCLLPLCAASAPALAAPPQTTTSEAQVKVGAGYMLRLPWGYDARFAAPLVLVAPKPGQKAADAIRSAGWEQVADRWGIVLIAPDTAGKEAALSALRAARRQVKVAPGCVYLYRDEQSAALDLPEVQAVAVHFSRRASTTDAVRTAALSGRQGAREAWAFFDAPSDTEAALASDTTHRLTLVITGLSDDRGQVAVSLWNRKAYFGDSDKAAYSAIAPISGGQAEVTFTVREPSTYAALVLHDRNRDGKMDTSFGFPLEGFGASGNPKIGFGAPGWDDCYFSILAADRERRLVVKAVYLGGG